MKISNEFLENLKIALITNNQNISLLENNIINLNNKNCDTSDLKKVSDNSKVIENFLCSIIPLLEEHFKSELANKKDSLINTKNNPNLIENTLIISETRGKVFLPYYIQDIKNLSNENNSSIEEIIEKDYSIPISSYKSLAISRFREAFNLARRKEKKSLKYSFDLATELLFNYNLHPAIISACRNLDELDIYLDCLDSGETDKFSCFNIVFEIPPVIYKNK